MVLRRLFVLLVAVFLYACGEKKKQEEYFEGVANYQNDFILKTGKYNIGYFDSLFGRTVFLSYKDGNWLETYGGGVLEKNIYRVKENKNYFKYNNSDTVTWYDCSKNRQRLLKYEINRKKEKILGIECDELVNYYENKIVRFYFADTFKINPEWYEKFRHLDKDVNARRMGALFLKYVLEYKDFSIVSTATHIERKKINDQVFDLPSNAILVEDKK